MNSLINLSTIYKTWLPSDVSKRILLHVACCIHIVVVVYNINCFFTLHFSKSHSPLSMNCSNPTPLQQLVDDYIQISKQKSETVQETDKMIYNDVLTSIHLYLDLLSFGNSKETAVTTSTPAKNMHGTNAQGNYIHDQAKQLYLSFLAKHEKALESNYKTNAHTAKFLIDIEAKKDH